MRRGVCLLLSEHDVRDRWGSFSLADVLSALDLPPHLITVRSFGKFMGTDYQGDQFAYGLIDERGTVEWLPAIQEGDTLRRVTVDELKRMRMAWLCPEGVS